MRRVFLLTPTTTYYPGIEHRALEIPTGLAYIASALRAEGHMVQLFDASLKGADDLVHLEDGGIRFGSTDADIAQAIAAFEPHVVGVSSLFSSQAENALDACRIARQAAPEAVIVMGGAHPSSCPEQCLASTDVDAVVSGPGEAAFPQLVTRGMPEGGIARAPLPDSIDDLPPPAWDLVPPARYARARATADGQDPTIAAPVLTSRGCPNNCSYCFSPRMHGTRFAKRRVPCVLDEIRTLKVEYGVEEIQFIDDNLTYDRDRALDLCNGLKGLGLSWSLPSGVYLMRLDRELLLAMRDSGCRRLTIACESGSQRVISRIMKKPLDLKKAEEVVRICADIGLGVNAYWMLGLPGETKRDVRKTIDFARRLRAIHGDVYSSFSIFTPFPGTPLFEQCARKGCILDLSPKAMRYGEPCIATEDFDAAWIKAMRREAWILANEMQA